MGSGDYVFVDEQRLERRLAQLRADADKPNDGLFGPGSMTWRVNREAILFLGAGRAALLQTAHPWVGAAMDQQSTTKEDPISRFHRTFTVVFSMVFGRSGHRHGMPSTQGAWRHWRAAGVMKPGPRPGSKVPETILWPDGWRICLDL